jgi:hypothetical protein
MPGDGRLVFDGKVDCPRGILGRGKKKKKQEQKTRKKRSGEGGKRGEFRGGMIENEKKQPTKLFPSLLFEHCGRDEKVSLFSCLF